MFGALLSYHGHARFVGKPVVSRPSKPLAEPDWSLPTTLDEVGLFSRQVSEAQAAAWNKELQAGHAPLDRAAALRVWLGEYALAHDQQPGIARWQFRQVEKLARRMESYSTRTGLVAQPPAARGEIRGAKTGLKKGQQTSQPVIPSRSTSAEHLIVCGGVASYDSAMSLFYSGAYQDAADAFHHLLTAKDALPGFDRRRCALWYRHAVACAGYHDVRAKMGIPEPPRLDPLCGAAALAACLRSQALPFSQKTLLASCRVTGEGSTLQDVLNAGPRLHVSPRAVTADDRGLQLLPKPLVAYVEHDHFVAVVRADAKGVSYLCSDCGLWPGGRVDLTWKQWRALDPGLYVAVTKPGSAPDSLIAAALGEARPVARVAFNGSLAALHLRAHLNLAVSLAAMHGHVFKYFGTTLMGCGNKPSALHCASPVHCPLDKNNHCNGPSSGEPVNLATGEEEYTPSPDITVYNPAGPPVVWSRIYNSLRGPDQNYQAEDFGIGWSQPYNMHVYDPSIQYTQGIGSGGGTTTGGTSGGGTTTGGTSGGGTTTGGYGASRSARQAAQAAAAGQTTGTGGSPSFPAPAGGTKTLFMPNGSSVQITFPTINSDGLHASCTVLNGNAFLVSWDRAAVSDPFGTYTVTQADRTQWQFGVTPYRSDLNITVRGVPYMLQRVTDRNGRSFVLSYSYTYYIYDLTTDRAGNPISFTADPTYTSAGASLNSGTIGSLIIVPSNFPLLDAIQDAEGHPLLTIMRARNTPGVVWPTYRGNSSTDLPTYAGALFAGNITSVFDRYGRQIYYHTGTYADTASPPAYPQSFQGLDYVSQLTPSSLYSRLVNGNYSDCPNPQNWGIATDYFCRDLTATSQYRPTQNSPNAPPARYIYGYQNISNLYGQETVPFLHALTVPSPQQDTTSLSYSTALINYDPKTDLVSSVTDGNGNSRAYTSIDYGDTQVSFLDTSGNTVFSHTVSFDGNMGEVSDTDGTNKTLIYSATYADPNDPYMPSTVLDGNGSANGGTTGKTLMTWDQYGNLRTRTSLRKIGSYPVVTTNTWDYAAFPLGRLMSIQVLGKNPTTFDYWEPSGLPKTITYPSPGGPGGSDIGQSTQQESFTYDAFGNILTITTPKNGYTRTGLQTATITTTFNYNNPSTGVSAVCEPISVSDNAGHVTQYRYDEQGNVTAFFDSLNHETDATYNIANQRTYIAFPATNRNGYGMRQSSATFAYAYPSGPENCETSFDELGHQVHVAYSGYDLEGQPINVHGSGVQPSSCQYDAAGRRVTLTDGNNQTTRYYYNAAGYSDAVTYPGYAGPTPAYDQVSGTWSNVSGPDSTRVAAYDNDGNPTRCVDGNGREVDYTYNDPDSLLTDVNFIADSSLNVHYHYDSYGRQDTVRDSTGSRSYVFDDDDNVTQATTYYIGAEAYGASGHTISYHFYGDGSRSSMTTPAGNFWYQYDSANHLQSVTGPNSVGASWTYYDNSQLKQQTLSNGVTTTYTYDAKGALSRQSNTDQNGLQFSSFTSLTYDGADNQTGVTAYLAPPQGIYGPGAYTNKTYSYDSHDQLTSENRTQSSMPNGTYFDQYAINYVYDNNAPSGNGNATTFRNNATTYDADNQLKSFNGNNGFQYDGNGNPVKYQATSLNFDAQDNLTLINGRLSASYRSDGLRASKLDPSSGNRQWFLYDGSELLCELDSTGNVTAWNLWGANGLAARETGGTAYNNAKAFNTYYVFDPQGNMAQRLDWQGNILSSSTYDAYGLQSSIDTSGDPYNGFGAQWGYYKDTETGLSLLGLRYYDPGTGRFLTRDPIGYAGGENLYRYCHNNPLSGIDPTGTYDRSSDNIIDDGSDVVSNRETSTAGMFSGRDPVFQQAGLDTAGLLLRSVPGVGPVYAGISAATGCDSLTLRVESHGQRGWDGVQAVVGALPLLGMFGGESTYSDISHWNTPLNIKRMKALGNKIDPGVFVIVGKPSKWNWLRTGQASAYGGKYDELDVITATVPTSSLHMPGFPEWINGAFFGHRIYDPRR